MGSVNFNVTIFSENSLVVPIKYEHKTLKSETEILSFAIETVYKQNFKEQIYIVFVKSLSLIISGKCFSSHPSFS